MWGCLILFAKDKFRCKLKLFEDLIKKIKDKSLGLKSKVS